MNDDISTGIADVVKATLSASLGEWTKLVTKEQLTSAVSDATAEAFGAAAREVVKAGVGSIAGPLLKVLLKLSDETSTRVAKLLREPVVTGLREAAEALAIPLLSPGDATIIAEKLQNADARLAQAYTVAEGTKDAWRIKVYVALMRGLIAVARNAHGVARNEFGRVVSILSPHIDSLRRKRAEEAELQEGNWLGAQRGFYGAGTAILATSERLERLRKQLLDMETLDAFAAAQLDELRQATEDA